MRLAAASAALLLLAVSPARAEHWTVDPAKSRLGFSGTQTGTAFQGSFKSWQAEIEFDPARPEDGHAVVTIDMASAATGDTQRDTALPQAEWFNVKQFPQARFEARSFRATGPGAFEAVGTLSIRGMSQDCVLPFTLALTGDTAVAKGHVQIIRTSFGVGQGPWTSGEFVALEVGVDVDLTAKRAG